MNQQKKSKAKGWGLLPHLRAAALGCLGGWLLLVAEYVLVLLVSRAQLTSVWEVQTATIRLLPPWFFLGAIPAGLGGVGAFVLRRMRPVLPARIRVAIAGFFGAFVAAVGWGIGGGRHLATLQARAGFALVLSLVVGAGVYILLPVLVRLLDRRRPLKGPRVAAFLFTVGIVVLEVANRFLLVRLYPAFHLGLTLLALLLAGAVGAWTLPGFGTFRSKPGRTTYLAGATIVACALTFVPASRSVVSFDNIRWIVSESSPTLSVGMRAMAWVAPPASIDEGLITAPLGQRRPTDAVDLRGRDVLLITIDALRADHVGAYGYDRPVSPALDRLAQEGVVFDAAYAPTPHTSYSVTSLMTGKYMRPLLLQGAGQDSDLWATLLQSYDYRTAAFFPPAVFFIDSARFRSFQDKKLGFEYAKVEFAEGDLRIGQVKRYLNAAPKDHRVFTWVHLFGPHEPYEAHAQYDFGKTDLDLYDAEIRAADETVGQLVSLARERDPRVVVLITADHGEEFGDHGGRYHGTSVYDEQVRVPLIISAAGLAEGRRVTDPVQTIDLLPTVLDGLKIPIPPRIRGQSLASYLEEKKEVSDWERVALAETGEYTLLAEEKYRLICQRKSGACQLFDIESDPHQTKDLSRKNSKKLERLREKSLLLAQSHGRYESQGLRAEGKGWPAAILLGISGNAEVAPELATLLDDADVGIRRKAAELLFNLATTGQAPALRLALTREEDLEARAFLALALTRVGQGAPLVYELLQGEDSRLRRFAALALAESGADDGQKVLVRWWAADRELEFDTARRILAALAQIRAKDAVPHLIQRLGDVRLRPYIASTLAEIGDRDARPHLAAYLVKERYHSAREPLARAVLALGGEEELIVPLRRFLGVPERLSNGLALAQEAGVLEELGGPDEVQRRRLTQLSDSGVELTVIVPAISGPRAQVRLIVRARSTTGQGGNILVQPATPRIALKKGAVRVRNQPSFSGASALQLPLASGTRSPEDRSYEELAIDLPDSFGARPGHHLGLQIFAPGHIEIVALAAVPLQEDLPPPPPEPWKPTERENLN